MYPSPGELVEGKYRIDKMLGEGAMGGVFAAFHTLRRANVALKFMSEQAASMPEAVERFMNEAVAASQIESDHVVRIYDVGRWEKVPYLVMEFLVGHDLAHEIEQQKREPMPVARAVHFTLQILRALQVAHARGIVHRDLKPANAFVVEKDGEPDFVKLLDFGISKQTESGAVHLTKTNVAMGTPLYMAPEQAKSARDADQRSDLYSVACILYELLSGRPPHEADNYNLLLYKLFQEEPTRIEQLRPDCPRELADLIHRQLDKDPNARVQTASELAAQLAPFSDLRSAALLARMLAGPKSQVQPWASIPPPSLGAQANVAIPANPVPPGATLGTGQDPNAKDDARTSAVANTALAFGASQPPTPSRSRAPLFAGAAVLVAALAGAAFLARNKPEPPIQPATTADKPEPKGPEKKPEPAPDPIASTAPSPALPSASASVAVDAGVDKPAPTAKPASTGKKTLKGMDIMK